MTVIDLAEARKASRRRVMDLALIRFGEMSVGCVIRNLTDEGAALDVGPQSDIPDQFTLVVMTKKKIYPCNVVWRKNHRIGVSFRARIASHFTFSQPGACYPLTAGGFQGPSDRRRRDTNFRARRRSFL
jgi:hypothetical protein